MSDIEYEIIIDEPKSFTIELNEQGPAGPAGRDGPQGPMGIGINSWEKTGTEGLTDIYTITYTNGVTQTFTVNNGRSIEDIELTSTFGLVDTYTITFNDGTTFSYTITNGQDGQDGQAAEISNVTASVDNTVGTPSVIVTMGGTSTNRTFDFSFHNLKGETGSQGPSGVDTWGGIGGDIQDQQDLQDEFDTKQDKFIANTPLYFGNALISPATSTEASQSSYSYSNYWTYYYSAGITSVGATYVDGHPYNHLNSIPFEFNKVYKLTSGTYAQYIGSDPLAMTAKFGYYDEYLEKYIPYLSFNQQGYAVLVRIPQTADGNPQTSGTGVTVAFPTSSDGSITEFTSTKDRYVYVQKVKDEHNNVKLYVAGWLGWPNWSYAWRSNILKDPTTEDDSKPFSEALIKCNRIIFCGNNSNDLSGYEGATYYEIEGTLDQITDVAQLGEAKHYSASQPAVYGDYGLNVGWDRNKIMLDSNNNLTVNESALTSKQDTLVSGTNIKTINNESVLGSGNISLPTVTVDSQLDLNSTNPVQNGVITSEINSINNKLSGIETILNDINSGSGGGSS